ncbi:hypothetical protein C1M55_31640 (plasmid) [Rhodococcus qingshengii]|nr:hypothetical protein C1M55_02565 [Rhodococcus qingshengii]AUS35810.1 hypothetical protein C1M55_31640 [Rhodococcus qingshengii]OMQ31543.1 hypothetical protein BK799_20990 [Rhodococcus sp. D-1]
MIHRRRLALTIPIAAVGGSELTPMDIRSRVFNASPISQTSGETSMDDSPIYQPGRDDLAAIVSGIERHDDAAVREVVSAMTEEELTRLDLAAAIDHAEHLEAFDKHLTTYQTVDALIFLVRNERAQHVQGGN